MGGKGGGGESGEGEGKGRGKRKEGWERLKVEGRKKMDVGIRAWQASPCLPPPASSDGRRAQFVQPHHSGLSSPLRSPSYVALFSSLPATAPPSFRHLLAPQISLHSFPPPTLPQPPSASLNLPHSPTHTPKPHAATGLAYLRLGIVEGSKGESGGGLAHLATSVRVLFAMAVA